MIPRLKPTLGAAELLAAWSPPRRDEVVRFESAFAELMGQHHALAFPYGRAGLMLLLEALGLKGREVICPGLHLRCGALCHRPERQQAGLRRLCRRRVQYGPPSGRDPDQ